MPHVALGNSFLCTFLYDQPLSRTSVDNESCDRMTNYRLSKFRNFKSLLIRKKVKELLRNRFL